MPVTETCRVAAVLIHISFWSLVTDLGIRIHDDACPLGGNVVGMHRRLLLVLFAAIIPGL
jgi:hypothetical protein